MPRSGTKIGFPEIYTETCYALENMIVLGIVGAGMIAFAAVTFWLTTESGARRKQERDIVAAE